MATVVLGGLGAVAGSLIPGAGWMLGWSVGAALGGIYDEMAGQRSLEGSRLKDLRLGGSQEGVPWPTLWGRFRVPGNVVWATDENGDHLVEHKRRRGGGGGSAAGGGSATEYWYSATFAVAFLQASVHLPDLQDPYGGEIAYRAPQLKRLWFDDKLVWADGVALDTKLKLGQDFYYHSGAESQAPDAVIEAKEGPGNCTAYPGLAYIVVQDLDLSDFSQRVPNVSAEFRTSDCVAGDALYDLCRWAGVPASRIDVSQATQPLTGYLKTGISPPQEAIDELCAAYALDLVSVDGVLRFVPRGGAVSFTLGYDELGATTGEEPNPRRYERRTAHPAELPYRFSVQHYDVGASYQQATQFDTRQSGNRQLSSSLSLNLALTTTAGRRIAARRLDEIWAEGETFSFSVPYTRLALAPGDVGWMPTETGPVRVKITEIQAAPIGEWRMKAVRDRPQAQSQTIVGSTRTGPAVSESPDEVVATVWTAWSGRELRDEDQSAPGIYVAATGARGWRGCTVLYSLDGGDTWLVGANVTARSTFGTTTSALGASGARANEFDEANAVGVTTAVSQGRVEPASDATVLAGLNHALIGGEIVGVADVILTGSYTYDLIRLRRGERGTKMTGHASGERFVMLSDALARLALPASSVGGAVMVKCVSPGEDPEDVGAVGVVVAPRTPTPEESRIAALPTYETSQRRRVDLLDVRDWSAYGYVPSGVGFYRTPDGHWSTDLEWLDELGDVSGHTVVYLDPAGSDAASGTSWATAKKSVKTILAQSGDHVLLLKPGAVWPLGLGWEGQEPGGDKVVVSADPRIPAVLSMEMPNLAWTLDSGTTWKATGLPTGVGGVHDESAPETSGMPARYARASSVSGCRAETFSYHDAGSTVYVNTGKTSAPGGWLKVWADAVNGRHDDASHRLRVRNVRFAYGDAPFRSVNGSGTMDQTFWDCEFRGGGGGEPCALFDGAGRTVLKGCLAQGADGPGLVWKGGREGIEDGVTSSDHGAASGSTGYGDNAASSARGAKVIRVGGAYLRSGGPILLDRKDGAVASTLNLGCRLGDSGASGDDSADVRVGASSGDGSRVWLLEPRYGSEGSGGSTSINQARLDHATLYLDWDVDPRPKVVDGGSLVLLLG